MARRTTTGRAPAKGRRKPGHRRRSPILTFVGRSFAVLGILSLVLALVAVIAALVFYQRTELPDPNKDFATNTTFIYYRDGTTKLGNFAVQNRQTIPYADMSQYAKDAVIAAENRTFWTDRGISPSGIARSAWSILRGGEIQGGGSTITQQYIKIYYLTSDRTMTRKMRELALAVKMGREKPKEEILRDYLNTIYFGRGAYGLQAASRAYFLTDAKKLTLEQSAVLASVLNNPTMFDPSAGAKNEERLLNRYRYVLDGMLEMGTITQAQHGKAWKALPPFPEVPLNNRYAGPQGHLMAMVHEELLNQGFTDAQINGGGLRVTTTFDAMLQQHAISTAQSMTRKVASSAEPQQDAANLHVAISSVDATNGEVLALYGGPDYLKNSRNWSTTARPSASTFKVWAAVAALRNGKSLYSQFNGNTFTPEGDATEVRNEFGYQYGEVSLSEALEKSVNTAFVDMTQQLQSGPAKVVKAANDAGIPTRSGWDLNNRIALGTAEVSPLDNAIGFATLVNSGKRSNAHVIKQVKDINGKTLFTAKGATTQAIEKPIAADVTHALKSVVDQGTGRAVSDLGFPIAGKTGTSGVEERITSAWFVAATRQISTSVMFVAGDGGNGDLDPYKRPGDGTFFGGTYPAQTWAEFMKVAMKGKEPLDFDEPAWVNTGNREEPSRAPGTNSEPSVTVPESSQAPTTSEPATSSAPPTTEAPTSSATETTTEPSTSAPPTQTTEAAPEPTQPTRPTQPPAEPTTRPTQPPAEPTARTTAARTSEPTASTGP
ncbi:transglycosylase domain-containing protein [Aestuariimicrobium sp. p3-SID1156]|uniref:transglycosylase domain-containing protein n=1 Tax=Aestuariimicrobium sp. p3-SID1156 TaxID=2916038 RepID=UPI00223B80D8|nr:transglycosylase domain-containing protein [Aestuariimicrobium sp. p3-SID1156]MCT1458009.1 transglycosylase domain-containing protein [Aestuariimicrobium sp. p3-SID1156]